MRTAIYGASLLCVALVKSCVGQKKPRGVPVMGAGRGVFLVSAGTRWKGGSIEYLVAARVP